MKLQLIAGNSLESVAVVRNLTTVRQQANELLNAPDPSTLKGKRDRAILALLISCGPRRAELVGLEVGRIQQRGGRWVIPDLGQKETDFAPSRYPPR